MSRPTFKIDRCLLFFILRHIGHGFIIDMAHIQKCNNRNSYIAPECATFNTDGDDNDGAETEETRYREWEFFLMISCHTQKVPLNLNCIVVLVGVVTVNIRPSGDSEMLAPSRIAYKEHFE